MYRVSRRFCVGCSSDGMTPIGNHNPVGLGRRWKQLQLFNSHAFSKPNEFVWCRFEVACHLFMFSLESCFNDICSDEQVQNYANAFNSCFILVHSNGLWWSLKQESEATVSLKQVLHQFSSDSCPMASSAKDISPHLFFICLLHLANEHSLSLHDRPTLDELDIRIPSSAFVK